MLEKRTKLQLADKDIYINIVGGMKITRACSGLSGSAWQLRLLPKE